MLPPRPSPPALLGTNAWTDLLAVHEYRHVVQFDKALQGYGRILYTLLGSQGLSFPAQLVTPGWFAEGDAVGTETILTRSGRGRIPEFELGMRTNLLTRPVFSFAKATGGSFRDNVPNYYELGYFLTTKLKRSYGPNAWSKALNQIYTQFPFYPFSFSDGLRKSTRSAENPTGTSTDALYRETMADLIETWKKKRESLTITPATRYPVSAEKARTARPVFTNYRFPQYLTDSTILCIKSGLGDISQLVLLSRNGVEKRVYKQGLVLNDPAYFSATPQLACWVENRYDPRWRSRIYDEIKVLDLATNTLHRLSTHGRYTAVAISPDNQKLMALRNETDNQNRLVVLDANTGRELSVLPNPANDLYIHPRWHNNRQIVTVTLSKKGKTIEYIDTQTGEKRALLPVSNTNISNPQSYGNTHILFNSPQSGIDNIYAVEIASGQVSQVTSRPFGAYHAAVSPNIRTLAVQDYDTHGFRIAELPLDPAAWIPVTGQADQTTRYFGPLLNGNQALTPIATDSIPAVVTTAPQRYRRLTNALNVYGWGPAFTSNGQGLTVGIQSQDVLATTQVSAAYVYNQSEQTGAFSANLSYQGLYPVIDVGFQTGNRRTLTYTDKARPIDSLSYQTWRYNQFTAGVRLPLVLTQSRFNQSASLSAYYGILQVSNFNLPRLVLTETGNGTLQTLTYGAAYSYTLRQSYRDVGPRLGVAVSTSLRHTPFAQTNQLTGSQWGTSLSVYLPGIGKHHNLRLRGAYQYQTGVTESSRVYQFQASVLYPRGAGYIPYDNLLIGGADYRLPLADTHISLTRLLYIQRIKGGLFSDYARGNSRLYELDSKGRIFVSPYSNYDWTIGSDLSFVFNPLRLRTPLEFGVRTIFDVRRQQWLVQPLVIDIGF